MVEKQTFYFKLRFYVFMKSLSINLYIFGLAYYSAPSNVKIISLALFYQTKVENFLLRFSSFSWTNFEKQMSGKYKHLLISFQRYQPFYSTIYGWKVVDKNKNTAHLFDTDFMI